MRAVRTVLVIPPDRTVKAEFRLRFGAPKERWVALDNFEAGSGYQRWHFSQ